MLRRYRSDPSLVIEVSEIEVVKDVSYEEKPEEVLDEQIKKLRTKEIPMVKVKWSYHSPKEATWEVEEAMRKKYPKLFENKGNK